MKKLSKKNQKIIHDVKDSISVDLSVMQDFADEGRYQMVRHSQNDIKAKLNGIACYLIHSDNKNWSSLKDAFHEIESMGELGLDYYFEVLESDRFISEADYEKYFAKA